jgi:hypothetical protein
MKEELSALQAAISQIQSQLMLTAMVNPHPCVAFLPFRIPGCQTEACLLPKWNQHARRPHPDSPSPRQTPAKTGRRSNWSTRNDDYELGRQRNRARGPLHTGYHSVPGVQPFACIQLTS